MGVYLEDADYVDGMESESREKGSRNEGGKPSWEEEFSISQQVDLSSVED